MNNMLTLEEVRSYLEVDQDRIEKFLRDGKLHAYKIGGTYIRFRKDEILNLHSELLPKKQKSGSQVPLTARVGDFWRFNNFYILSLLAVVTLILIVTKI